jgi:NAD(P)-dependent dehydrogenase (short-subunit alcohol dehydrogenase family)
LNSCILLAFGTLSDIYYELLDASRPGLSKGYNSAVSFMVLRIAEAVVLALLPYQYWALITTVVVGLLVIRAFAQGRTTNRERDLHARVILVTVRFLSFVISFSQQAQGGFTPFGLTLIQSLAERGAHIIALSSLPINSTRVEVLINLLRSTTNNEQIFAEECDLTSPGSIHAFCTRFLTGHDQRLDAILFAHEYQHIGSIFSSHKSSQDEGDRTAASLATFLIITLLLPALLVAPVERDIRIINVVNPFYAAAAHSFSPAFSMSRPKLSTFLQEGRRSLRLVVLTRHLQRVLDALPSAQVHSTSDATSIVPVVSQKTQRSNIVAISVSPGISRSDTAAPLLQADGPIFSSRSLTGILLCAMGSHTTNPC